MHYARPLGVVVAAEEILARVGDHVARRNRDIRVPAQVIWGIRAVGHKIARHLVGRHAMQRTLAIGNAIVGSETVRKLRHRALGMIGDVTYIWREERLILLVNAGRD